MIPVSELSELLRYDHETGRIFWRVRRSNLIPAGREAFTASKNSGHKHGLIHRKAYMAHRVAWALHYGEWPSGSIDHINGVPDDNRIENLRLASASENAMNRRPNRGKASGLPHGVSRKSNGRYFAQIQKGGVNYHLGYFGTVDEARSAYMKAKEDMGFHENHGAILKAYRAQQQE